MNHPYAWAPAATHPRHLSPYFTVTCLCTELLTRVAYHFLWRVTFTFDFMDHQDGKNYQGNYDSLLFYHIE